LAELTLHSRPVHTVFDLLGSKEDDCTYSLGWALAQSDALADALLREFLAGDPDAATVVRLQESVPGSGRTDIELETVEAHVVLEAKRGWTVPSIEQLQQYTPRFLNDIGRKSVLAVVGEGSSEWALPRLPKEVGGIPVQYASWARVAELASSAADGCRSSVEKRLLRELCRYLKGVMTMRDTESNMVYVVSLGTKPLVSDGTSFADIVVKHNTYFHPVGGPGRYPKVPPNYLGFRFGGKLQQIRHVEDYEVHDEPWNIIVPALKEMDWPPEPHFWYQFGPPIIPPREVRVGPKIKWSARVWVPIDLLLTCETLSEALEKARGR
jgi:hypothetical protein